MTSGAQPLFSGAPTPVPGVTGGPGLPQGVASVDGTTGNVVITPPNNTVQIRKTASPQVLQVYEYFNSNTDFSRLSLNTQTGGPLQLAVETQPPAVIRDLQLITNRNLIVTASEIQPSSDATTQLGDPTHRFTVLYLQNQLVVGVVARGGVGNNGIAFDPDGSLSLTETNLTATTAGAAPGVYLKVVISGAPYKIQLLAV